MLSKVIPSHSIKAFRYRVHILEQDLWKEQNPTCRANLAMQLADAATTLARLEMREAQKYQLANSLSPTHLDNSPVSPAPSSSSHPSSNHPNHHSDDCKADHGIDRRDDRSES